MTTPESSADPQDQKVGVTMEEVRAEMDALGLAKLDAAISAAMNRKLTEQLSLAMSRIADLESQKVT
jgi:hypothetical protein